ncbi:uncharacterized protein LOC123305874 isoform X2 [Chrysoperla carnea]|uniref:uncharacterized protein LOC123305874 isoform X2 n=1 Tax=Chrysoperla carnea TaxID=189513 RepID=UPI001D095923|nr:uncharacterized protein LOC123305874 isoform X2 [Chrysoperla carnea]
MALMKMPPKEKRKVSHLFYVAYADICKRHNYQPLSLFKPSATSNKAILDICIDRIKYDEWIPILHALSHDNSLHFVAFRCRQHPKKIAENVDTEQKVRQAANCTRISILTKFVLERLIDAIISLISQSQFITVLILEGLPLSPELVQNLARSLAKNTTIQHLNLQHCLVGDEGCEILGKTIRHVSNITTLDVSNCNLTAVGVEHLAELIKYQKISRYSESWKQTLRYREPDLDGMRGLRRLTCNNNPDIGDEGLMTVCEVLQDDLWMKAIDFQNCGLTDTSIEKLISVLTYNGIMDIADIRRNTKVSQKLLQNVMVLLCKNSEMTGDNNNNNENKYQWLSTTSTLNSSSVIMASCSGVNNGALSITSQNGRNHGLSSSQLLNLNISNVISNCPRTCKSQIDASIKKSNTTTGNTLMMPIGRRLSETATTRARDVWTPIKVPAIVDCKPTVAEQLKQARNRIQELEAQLEDEKNERQRVDMLNVQLHSQLMEVIGRSGGDVQNSQKDGCVYVKKDVLEEIYQAFSDIFNTLPTARCNGKVKNNLVFTKLQSIIEESPPNSRDEKRDSGEEQNENFKIKSRNHSCTRQMNSSGDMQSSTPEQLKRTKSALKKRPGSSKKLSPNNTEQLEIDVPKAQHLFHAFLGNESDDDEQHESNVDDDFNEENNSTEDEDDNSSA